MIISPYRTSVTAAHQGGKSLENCTPDSTNRRGKAYLRMAWQMGKAAAEAKFNKTMGAEEALIKIQLAA